MCKLTIWQDMDIKISDFADMFKEEYPELQDKVEMQRIAEEINAGYLEDEQVNLNIEVPNGIFSYATLGLWNGHHMAFNRHEFSNIKDCLTPKLNCVSCNEFYVDENDDLVQEESHHDGTNVYTFRAWRSGVTDSEKERLRDAFCERRKEEALRLVCRYTKPLGPMIRKVYGWKKVKKETCNA